MSEELKERLDLICCGGIGDITWLYSKICNVVDQYDIHLRVPMPGEGERDLRAQPFLKYLSGITYTIYVNKRDAYVSLNAEAPETFKDVVDLNRKFGEVFCGPNELLGREERIENYLYDLKFCPNFLLNIPKVELVVGDEMLNQIKEKDKKLISIFASTIQGIDIWNLWSPEEWLDFILKIHIRTKGKVVFAIIGAEWDKPTADMITHYFTGSEITFHNLAGKTELGTAFRIIQQSDLFVSYNSGLAVLSSYWGVPTIMLYPQSLIRLLWSWPTVKSIVNRTYIPFVAPRVADTIPEAMRLLNG